MLRPEIALFFGVRGSFVVFAFDNPRITNISTGVSNAHALLKVLRRKTKEMLVKVIKRSFKIFGKGGMEEVILVIGTRKGSDIKGGTYHNL